MGLFSGLLGGLRNREQARVVDSLDLLPSSWRVPVTRPSSTEEVDPLRTGFGGQAGIMEDWAAGRSQPEAYPQSDPIAAGRDPRRLEWGVEGPWNSFPPAATPKISSRIGRGFDRVRGSAAEPRVARPNLPAPGLAATMDPTFRHDAESGWPAWAEAIPRAPDPAAREMQIAYRGDWPRSVDAADPALTSPVRSATVSPTNLRRRAAPIDPTRGAVPVNARLGRPLPDGAQGQDRLPTPQNLPAEIAADIEEWNKNDLGWEALMQSQARGAFGNGKSKWQREEGEALAKLERARRELADAQSRQAKPGRIDRLQRRVDSLARSARIGRVAREEAAIQATERKIEALRGISERLTRFARGKAVRLRPNGGPEESYTIKGPGEAFDSPEAAARDGIALSYFVTSLTRDPHERGGRIIALGGGKYTYEQLDVGTYPRTDMVIAGKAVPKDLPFARITRKPGLVGYFHIHPDNSKLVKADNARFSSTDKDSYRDAAKGSRNIEAYLGGSDGSLTVMRGGKAKSILLQPSGYFPVPRTR